MFTFTSMRKFYLPFFLAAIILLLSSQFLLDRCQYVEKRPTIQHDTVKVYIDKLRDTVKLKTEIRNKVITKYIQVRHDSLIPCETKLYYCDTLVMADSSLIANYKKLVYSDSLFMELQSKKIQDTCRYFKKKIRQQKLQKWGAIGLLILSTSQIRR